MVSGPAAELPCAVDAALTNYLWMSRWSDAERCFRHVLDMEPSDAPARCHLATALAHQGSARELEHIVRTIAFHGGPATTDLDFWRMAVPTKPFAQPDSRRSWSPSLPR